MARELRLRVWTWMLRGWGAPPTTTSPAAPSGGAAPRQPLGCGRGVRWAVALALRVARAPWWLRALPPILCALAIWGLSAQPGKEGPSPWWRSCAHNGAHVVAYGALGVLTWLALGAPAASRRSFVAVACAALYGVVDEVHQFYVPRRAASLGDVVSDFAGACLCVGLARWWVHADRQGRRLALWSVPLAVAAVAFESLA